jgi:hypothetical protein
VAALSTACFSEASAPSTGSGSNDPAPSKGSTNTDNGAGGSTTKNPAPTNGNVNSGANGTGGSTSNNGATDKPAANTGTEDLIDDMEGGTGSILAKSGRVGAWYVYNDGSTTGTQTPGVPFEPTELKPARGTSVFAARMTGSGFATWGAGMGFNFNDPGDGKGGSLKSAYDASAYQAITFWAKAGAGSAVSVRINVSTKDTDPAGGVCASAKCSDHFGRNLNLTTEWEKYTVRFSDLTQSGWGQAVAKFDASAVYAVQFQVGKGATFDIYVDDVAFLGK